MKIGLWGTTCLCRTRLKKLGYSANPSVQISSEFERIEGGTGKWAL